MQTQTNYLFLKITKILIEDKEWSTFALNSCADLRAYKRSSNKGNNKAKVTVIDTSMICKRVALLMKLKCRKWHKKE